MEFTITIGQFLGAIGFFVVAIVLISLITRSIVKREIRDNIRSIGIMHEIAGYKFYTVPADDKVTEIKRFDSGIRITWRPKGKRKKRSGTRETG